MAEEKTLLNAVLCFPVRTGEVMLGLKLQKIGAGKLNGWGGGIESGEMPIQAMIRELFVESGGVKTEPGDYEKVAVIDFHNTKTDGTAFVCRVHIYLLLRWEGEFRTTDEIANPRWHRRDGLPLDEMMPADRAWLPPILAGRKLIGRAKYGPFQRELLEPMEIRYVVAFRDE